MDVELVNQFRLHNMHLFYTRRVLDPDPTSVIIMSIEIPTSELSGFSTDCQEEEDTPSQWPDWSPDSCRTSELSEVSEGNASSALSPRKRRCLNLEWIHYEGEEASELNEFDAVAILSNPNSFAEPLGCYPLQGGANRSGVTEFEAAADMNGEPSQSLCEGKTCTSIIFKRKYWLWKLWLYAHHQTHLLCLYSVTCSHYTHFIFLHQVYTGGYRNPKTLSSRVAEVQDHLNVLKEGVFVAVAQVRSKPPIIGKAVEVGVFTFGIAYLKGSWRK